MSSIFVSVVSYRDSLLNQTVVDLLDKQSGLNDITVGIFEQTIRENSLEVINPELIKQKNIRYKRIDPEYAAGVGWARHINALQIKNEEFFFQIDSHMLFDKGWDVSLIEDWNLGKEKHNDNKTIISTSCKGYDFDENGNIIHVHYDAPPITAVMRCFELEPFNNLVALHGEYLNATDDIFPGIHTCAGNFFSHTDWVREIGPDPKMYFSGEEQKMVLSSFFAGYHMYHPRKIISYHYNGSGNYVTKPWCKPLLITEDQYSDFCNSSREYWLKYLENLGEEKLKEFYEYSGIDYVNKCFDEAVRSKSMIVIPPEERVHAKSPWAEE
jgi:hypothetical protein